MEAAGHRFLPVLQAKIIHWMVGGPIFWHCWTPEVTPPAPLWRCNKFPRFGFDYSLKKKGWAQNRPLHVGNWQPFPVLFCRFFGCTLWLLPLSPKTGFGFLALETKCATPRRWSHHWNRHHADGAFENHLTQTRALETGQMKNWVDKWKTSPRRVISPSSHIVHLCLCMLPTFQRRSPHSTSKRATGFECIILQKFEFIYKLKIHTQPNSRLNQATVAAICWPRLGDCCFCHFTHQCCRTTFGHLCQGHSHQRSVQSGGHRGALVLFFARPNRAAGLKPAHRSLQHGSGLNCRKKDDGKR